MLKEHSILIPEIYEAAITPESWISCLDSTARMVGAKGGALLLLETMGVYRYSINYLTSNYYGGGGSALSEDAIEYQKNFSKYEQQAFTELGRSEPLTLFKDAQFEKDKAKIALRPDVAFLKKNYGVFERFGVRLNGEREYLNAITFQYDVARGNVTPDEWRSLQPVLLHIKTSVNLSRPFTVLKARYNAVFSVLNRIKMAYAVLLSTGEVIVANDSAQATFEKKDGIRLSQANKLEAADSELTAEIAEAVTAVSRTVVGESGRSAKLIVVPRTGEKDSLLLEVSPLRDRTRELDDFLTGALVTIVDPDEQIAVSTDGLQQLYGLSAAESEIAQMIVAGKTNRTIAQERSVSVETVKKQVASVLEKTDSNNRTALVRRVLSINLPIEGLC